jgi:hypothetical protein
VTTHPHGPKIEGKPSRNRHVVELARSVKHDARGAQEIMDRDCQRVLDWLGAEPLRTITSQGLRDWVSQQDPPWTKGYATAIKQAARAVLGERVQETGAETKARLLDTVDRLLPECRSYVTGNGPAGEGTVFLRDPVTDQYLQKVDHSAAKGYLQFVAQLTGVVAEEKAVQNVSNYVIFAPQVVADPGEWAKLAQSQVVNGA